MNYATVEEAKFSLLGKLVKMTLEGYPDSIGIVTELQTFADYAGYSDTFRDDKRPVAIITTQSGSNQGWFANDGDWEIYTV